MRAHRNEGAQLRRAGVVVLVAVLGVGVFASAGEAATPAKAKPACSAAVKKAHHGTCPTPRTTTTTTIPKLALQWSAPAQLDTNQYGLYSVSCPSASFCVAVGSSIPGEPGRAYLWNGNAWTPAAPEVFAPGMYNHVSCPSPTFCVAGGPGGSAVVWDGMSWSSSPQIRWPNPDDGITNVTCATTTFCTAADEDGDIRIWDGGSWSIENQVVPGTTSGGAHSISCPSATFCLAVNDLGNAIFWDGTSLSPPQPIAAGDHLVAASCSSPTFCTVLDTSGDKWLTWNGTSWSPAQPLGVVQPDPNPIFLNWLSCPSSTFCALALSNGTVTTWNGTTWSTPQSIDSSLTNMRGPAAVTTNEHPNLGLESVSCPSANFCVVVGSDGTAIIGQHS
jgi:hypothetical protein